MANIQPQGEALRQAVRWISGRLAEDPERKTSALIQEACARFNLTPKDEVYLESFYRSEGT
jgi:hypothetical protein